MNYIDKVLQEFDEKFNDSFKYNAMEGLKSAGVVKSFLKQALEEQRESIKKDLVDEIEKYVFNLYDSIHKETGAYKYDWVVEAMEKAILQIINEKIKILIPMNDEIEDKIIAEIVAGEDEENGEHSCIDGTDGTGNIDGTDGRCSVCGLTDLI
jgi:DNA repair photolyase